MRVVERGGGVFALGIYSKHQSFFLAKQTNYIYIHIHIQIALPFKRLLEINPYTMYSMIHTNATCDFIFVSLKLTQVHVILDFMN